MIPMILCTILTIVCGGLSASLGGLCAHPKSGIDRSPSLPASSNATSSLEEDDDDNDNNDYDDDDDDDDDDDNGPGARPPPAQAGPLEAARATDLPPRLHEEQHQSQVRELHPHQHHRQCRQCHHHQHKKQ